MSETAARLRRALVDIDLRILKILMPHTELDHTEIEKVAALEHARSAAQRLLLAAEAGELKDDI
jgi:hypothetical protein